MFACALALLASAYRGPDRGTAFGIWGATTGAAVAVGPLAGGALTQGIGWEAIFFVNIPFGIAVIALSLRYVEESRNEAAGRVDLVGLTLFSAALAALVFGLIRGNDEGFGSPLILTLLIGAAVLLALFVLVQRRSADPMLDLRLFRVPTFVGASLAAFALSATIFALFLYITLYIQNQLDYSALESGLRFLPTSLISFVVAPISGKFAEKLGIRWFVGVGLGLVGIGLILMSGIDPKQDWTALLPGLIVSAFGIGMVNPALATTAVGVVEPQRSGMASGINSTFRQVGIATGVALWGAVFASAVDDRVRAFASAVGGKAPSGGSGSFSDFISFGAYRQIGEQAVLPGRDAFLQGFDTIVLIAGIFAIVSGVLCAWLIRPRDFVAHG
jgi:EmrB/QacA subfamily drug resistance transporter